MGDEPRKDGNIAAVIISQPSVHNILELLKNIFRSGQMTVSQIVLMSHGKIFVIVRQQNYFSLEKYLTVQSSTDLTDGTVETRGMPDTCGSGTGSGNTNIATNY